jgi:hypothetical protein
MAFGFGLCMLAAAVATAQYEPTHSDQIQAPMLQKRSQSFKFMASSSNPASCCNGNVLTVQGQGNVKYNTTLASISLAVEYEGKNETAEFVLGVVANNASAVVSVLNSMNVQQLTTTSVNLNPIYDYQPNEPAQLIGYDASVSISYIITISEAGQTIDAAVNAGATSVQSVSFQAEPSVLLAARLQALQNAVSDAASQANAVTSVMGLTLGTPVSVDVDYVAAPPPSSLSGVSAAQIPGAIATTTAASIPIQGGPQEVTATVVIEYSI